MIGINARPLGDWRPDQTSFDHQSDGPEEHRKKCLATVGNADYMRPWPPASSAP